MERSVNERIPRAIKRPHPVFPVKIVVFSYDGGLLPFYPLVTMIIAAPDGVPPRRTGNKNSKKTLPAVPLRGPEAGVLRIQEDVHGPGVNRIDSYLFPESRYTTTVIFNNQDTTGSESLVLPMDLCHGLAIPDFILEEVIQHSFYERVGIDFEAPRVIFSSFSRYLAMYMRISKNTDSTLL